MEESSTRRREKHRRWLRESQAVQEGTITRAGDTERQNAQKAADMQKESSEEQESEINVTGQQKNKPRHSERRELIKLRTARKKRTQTVWSNQKLSDTAGNNKGQEKKSKKKLRI